MMSTQGPSIADDSLPSPVRHPASPRAPFLPQRVIVITGAPAWDSIESESVRLLKRVEPALARFLGLGAKASATARRGGCVRRKGGRRRERWRRVAMDQHWDGIGRRGVVEGSTVNESADEGSTVDEGADQGAADQGIAVQSTAVQRIAAQDTAVGEPEDEHRGIEHSVHIQNSNLEHLDVIVVRTPDHATVSAYPHVHRPDDLPWVTTDDRLDASLFSLTSYSSRAPTPHTFVSQAFTHHCESTAPLVPEATDGSLLSASWLSHDYSPELSPSPSPRAAFEDHFTPVTPVVVARLPSAAHLTAHPSSATTNLIVALVSVSLPQTVRTRRNTTAYLVELLVGDETRCGLGISFWHASLTAAEGMVRTLHRRDVVLIQDVGLGVYAGRVYGRSVAGQGWLGWRRGTRVKVLFRDGGGGWYAGVDLERDTEGNEQLDRTRVVAEWMRRFVAPRGGLDPMQESCERPPADSPH